MGRDEDRLPTLNGSDGDFLERVELEGVPSGGRVGGDVLGYRSVGVRWGNGNSMSDLQERRRKGKVAGDLKGPVSSYLWSVHGRHTMNMNK